MSKSKLIHVDLPMTTWQINHQPNPLKSLLLRLFISSLKRTMKESRWGGYMIAGGEWGGVSLESAAHFHSEKIRR